MSNRNLTEVGLILLASIFVASVCCLLLFVKQENFYWLLGLYSLAFGSYYGLYRMLPEQSIKWIWVVVILVRLASFFSPPQLSDDYYRFFWDAKVSESGVSVYAYTPSEFMNRSPQRFPNGLYHKLNSPDYYSVYPPFLQAHYYVSLQLSDGSLKSFVQVMRIQFFLVEALILLLMYFGLSRKRSWLLYAINPLVIIELMGNLHAELFVAAGIIFLLLKGKKGLILSTSMILAVGSKISPILLIPPTQIHKKHTFSWRYITLPLILSILAFYPLWWDLNLGANFLSSIRLYYQTFEFNGAFYVILRDLLAMYYGYNPIAIVGPSLQLISAVLILRLYLKSTHVDANKIPGLLIYIWLIYLLFSTTIHPWYLIPAVALLPFHFHWGVFVWSYSIVFSYAYYSDLPDLATKIIHLFEYILVLAAFVIELKKPLGLQTKGHI